MEKSKCKVVNFGQREFPHLSLHQVRDHRRRIFKSSGPSKSRITGKFSNGDNNSGFLNSSTSSKLLRGNA
jgi:hypothetical protein